MDETASSLVNVCDRLESGTPGDPNAIECCVNENNSKLVCATVQQAMDPILMLNILTNQDIDPVTGNPGEIGSCDRRAYNDPPTTNVCS